MTPSYESILLKAIVLFALAIYTATSAEQVISDDSCTSAEQCATKPECFLYNIGTKRSTGLGDETVEYDPSDSHSMGYSIGCTIPDHSKIEIVKFTDGNNKVRSHYISPETDALEGTRTIWMVGSPNNGIFQVNKVDLLNECGVKDVEVRFYSWSNEKAYHLSSTKWLSVANKASGCGGKSPTDEAPAPVEQEDGGSFPVRAEKFAMSSDSNTSSGPSGALQGLIEAPHKAGLLLSQNNTIHEPAPTTSYDTTRSASGVASCYLRADRSIFLGYNVDLRTGTRIEVQLPSGEMFSYSTASVRGLHDLEPSNPQAFGNKDFRIRFVYVNGAIGAWRDCMNYLGIQPDPPQSKQCFLWSNKLYFGNGGIELSGNYEVQVWTAADGQEFSYRATSADFVFANDFYLYGSQAFYLRLIDSLGQEGFWKRCVNYTPLALDIDGSGTVERIVGKFQIRVTTDGTAETVDEWFAPTEGILIDAKHGFTDGINTGHPLLGDQQRRTYIDSFEKLALLDANEDGEVSEDELDGLAIWVDLNSNAILDDDEMRTLESYGIVSLSVIHSNFVSKAIIRDGSTIIIQGKWMTH